MFLFGFMFCVGHVTEQLLDVLDCRWNLNSVCLRLHASNTLCFKPMTFFSITLMGIKKISSFPAAKTPDVVFCMCRWPLEKHASSSS